MKSGTHEAGARDSQPRGRGDHRSRRWFASGLLATVATGAAVACAAGSSVAATASTASKTPIVIGTDLPLSGELGGLAKQLLGGYKYGIQQINAEGGIDGHKLTLDVKDDQNEPADATNAVRELITQDHIAALMGSFGSELAIAGSAVAETYKIPNIQPFASDPAIVSKGYKYLFNTFHLPSQIEPVTDSFLESVVHPKRVAILNITDGWAVSGATVTKHDLSKHGIKVVADVTVPTGQSDYTSALSQIKAAKPDAIKLIMYDPDISVAIANAKQLGIKVKAFYVEGDPLVNPIVSQAVGTTLEGVIGTPNWYPGGPLTQANALAKKYTARTKQPASTEVIKGYQTVQILANALKKTGGNTNPQKLRAALAATSLNTVLGKVTFEKNGQADSPAIVTQFQGPHLKLVGLWPKQYAKGKYQTPTAL